MERITQNWFEVGFQHGLDAIDPQRLEDTDYISGWNRGSELREEQNDRAIEQVAKTLGN